HLMAIAGAIKRFSHIIVVAFTPVACAKSQRALLERSCDAGEADACYRLGTHLEYEAHDARAALPRYRLACDRSHARACTNLGSLYGRGEGVGRDDATAAALYKKACDGNDAMGCANLADFLIDGMGLPQDPRAGAALYERSCEQGYATACRDLGYRLV